MQIVHEIPGDWYNQVIDTGSDESLVCILSFDHLWEALNIELKTDSPAQHDITPPTCMCAINMT
jgi:hypothetical protein